MGNTLIIYNDPFNLKLAKHIQDNDQNVRVYVSDKNIKDTIGLQSLAPYSMLVEIGPVPQGVLYHEKFADMERITFHALDFIQKYFNSPDFDVSGDLEVYQRGTIVPYPTDGSGKTTAMLHQNIQNKNFCLLKHGDPLFVTFSGQVINYAGEPGYPVFINEAAYYKKNIAMRINKKIILNIPSRPHA
jgi:hypothetical protein